MGVWIGLAALALQILFAPVFSAQALAMALDPLADATICSAAPASDADRSPVPMKHDGHCAECCLIHCAADAPPSLPPVALDFVLPRAEPAVPAAAYARPLTRGPPPRALPATGPPFNLA